MRDQITQAECVNYSYNVLDLITNIKVIDITVKQIKSTGNPPQTYLPISKIFITLTSILIIPFVSIASKVS